GLVAAAQATDGDAAFLFSSDEEANDARCIKAFLARDHGFGQVVVAEPTGCEAVLAHRGISAVRMAFRGRAGTPRAPRRWTPARCTTRCAGATGRSTSWAWNRTAASAG